MCQGRTQKEDKGKGGKGRKKEEARGGKEGGYYWTEDAHKESMEDAQEATHENTSYIRWKPGRQGKDGHPPVD